MSIFAPTTPEWNALSRNAPFRKFSGSSQCGRLFKYLVKGFITNRKYAFVCVLEVRLSPDEIILIYWIEVDHILLKKIMIVSYGFVHLKYKPRIEPRASELKLQP